MAPSQRVMSLGDRTVLIVSKPLGPPWNDGSKNLARDVALGLDAIGWPAVVFAPKGAPVLGAARVELRDASLTSRSRVRLIAQLALDRRCILWHLVFAPSGRVTWPIGALAAMRRRPTVQTVASLPPAEVRLGEVVFADRVVVLSRAAEDRALAEGIPRARLVRIPPAISPPPSPTDDEVRRARLELGFEGRFVVCFPGDLEHDDGASLLLEACLQTGLRERLALVVAARPKGHRTFEAARALVARAQSAGLRARFVGEVASMPALLAASDLVALPARTTFAKVDHPLVLLEAMHLGRAVVVTEGTAAYELAEEGGAIGCAHRTEALAETLQQLVEDADALREAGQRARALARSRTVETMARAYAKVYESVLP